MLDLLHRLSTDAFELLIGMRQEPIWIAVTLALSALVFS